MDYTNFSPVVEKLVDKKVNKDGFSAWGHPNDGALSRTITGQVIFCLARCANRESNLNKREQIIDSINEGFNYISETIETGNSDLATFAFTIIASFEYNKYFPGSFFSDDLIKVCFDRMNSADFFQGDAYQFSNSADRRFYPTYLALMAYVSCLNYIHRNLDSYILNSAFGTEPEIVNKIEICFNYNAQVNQF